MDKNVSIVKVSKRNYRQIAQENWGLSKKQMRGMHVHHRIPRSKGGTNDPSNLYVCSSWFHKNIWHNGEEFIEAASRGGRLGGLKGGRRIADERLGICSEEWLNSPRKREASIKAGRAGKGSKKPGSGPQFHPVEVTHPDGSKTFFSTRVEAANTLNVSPVTISGYTQTAKPLSKGRFKGYQFSYLGGWRRFA